MMRRTANPSGRSEQSQDPQGPIAYSGALLSTSALRRIVGRLKALFAT
jgi:hypothetical protein